LVAIPSCLKVYESSQEEVIIHHEQKIVDMLGAILPAQVITEIEDHFEEVRGEPEHLEYLDSFAIAVDDLKNAVETNFSMGKYKEAVERAQDYWQSKEKAAIARCPGLGYSKSIKINTELAGGLGGIIVADLHALGGGGIKTVYDLVNLERQVYYYTFCGSGISLGVGASATLTASIGFTGSSEIITGIRYHGEESGMDGFEGASLSKSHSLSGSLAVGFDLGVSVGIGSSQSAHGNFTGITNLLPCAEDIILIENGKISYSFELSASVGAGLAAEIVLAYKNNTVTSNSHGVEASYKKFNASENFKRKFDEQRRRRLGALKMAAEILFSGPLPGLISTLDPVDVAASAFTLKYGSKDFTDCAVQLAAIGTKKVKDISSTNAICGGYIQDDGGAQITARGVCWSTTRNFQMYNEYTNDGTGDGDYTSIITGLEPNTTYYVKAYATSSAGTAYGEERSLRTSSEIINDPPIVTLSTPSNGAVGESTSQLFTWSCSDPENDPLTYDVFLGTSHPPSVQIASNQSAKNISRTGLNNNTQYFWYVIAYDDHGNSTSSPIWHFTTRSSASVNYTARYSSSVPNIDGVVNSSEWTNANVYGITFYRGNDSNPVNATLYLQHDNTYFYIGLQTELSALWDNYLSLRIDGDNSNTINGRSSSPHTDINVQWVSPGGWSGHNRYDYVTVSGNNPTTPPTGTLRLSSGSSNVHFEYRLLISDFWLNEEGIIGFILFNYQGGDPDTGYYFPENTKWDKPSDWEKILLE